LLIGFLTFSYRRIRKQNKEIKTKTKEFENVNTSLERSNEELERFAHIASHDLKSPLRNIISYTGLLRRNLATNEKSIVKDSLNFIENNGKRMSQLIEDILEYSRFSDQEINNQDVVNLNHLVKEISQFAPTTSKGRSVIFEIAQLPIVTWNSSKLFLLFKNIIENGIKYNKSEKPKIKIYSSDNMDSFSVYIEDNGIGIKEDYFDKIFVMFQRLHTQNQYEGTGLGLAICKKIVDEFEGKISVTSKLNKGTVFKIDFNKQELFQPMNAELAEAN